MSITSKLSLQYIKVNKKRESIIAIGVIIATVLITTVLSIFTSFRQYMVNIERNDRNWEAEFKEILYCDALKIKEDKNIKEISLYYDYGVSENVFTIGDLKYKIHLVAYDQNAIKNSSLKVTDGRLPNNSNEIAISSFFKSVLNYQVGDIIEHVFEKQVKKYKVVGIVEELDEDDRNINNERLGAITYLESSSLQSNTIINVRILTKKIKNIKKTTEDLVNNLSLIKHSKISSQEENKIEEIGVIGEIQQSIQQAIEEDSGKKYDELKKEQEKQDNLLIYNTNLLKYELVTDVDSSFGKSFFIAFIIIILVISMATIIIIYTAFKMVYIGRIKEFGALESIRYD